jgi:hypothetical protein
MECRNLEQFAQLVVSVWITDFCQKIDIISTEIANLIITWFEKSQSIACALVQCKECFGLMFRGLGFMEAG